MTMRFAFEQDGRAVIFSAAPKEHLERLFGELTEEQYRAHVIERAQIPANAIELSDDWTPPDDRTFRDAWSMNGKSVGIDMPKAREIHMGRIRRERDKQLAHLDIEQLKGDDVAAQKQALRDLPAKFDLITAKTPGELKALWPAELS